MFLKLWTVLFLSMEIFLSFGGWMLFDFNHRFDVAVAAVAFVAALLLNGFISYEKRIEQLEKRLAELEESQKKAE